MQTLMVIGCLGVSLLGGKLALSGLLSQEQELSNHQQMSKWTNMWPWYWCVCKYLSRGAVKRD